MTLGAPLASGTVEGAPFDRDALKRALRIDQAGESTFAEFFGSQLESWRGSQRSGSVSTHCQLLWRLR
jgi:hypothetical protein